MPWSAILQSASVANGVATLVLAFTDGTNAFTKTYKLGSPGDQFLEKQAAQEITNLNALDAYVAALKVGPIVPYVAPAPTASQQAATQFFAMYYKMLNLQAAINNGTAKPDQTFTDLQSAVKAAFLPEYTTDIRWK